eukprot:1817362-Amphidinium_carterae.1
MSSAASVLAASSAARSPGAAVLSASRSSVSAVLLALPGLPPAAAVLPAVVAKAPPELLAVEAPLGLSTLRVLPARSSASVAAPAASEGPAVVVVVVVGACAAPAASVVPSASVAGPAAPAA